MDIADINSYHRACRDICKLEQIIDNLERSNLVPQDQQHIIDLVCRILAQIKQVEHVYL